MTTVTQPTDAASLYSAAHAAHYSDRDLPLALRRYRAIATDYPTSVEAEYSRMQVRNIVAATVPPAELLDAEMDLARRYLQPT